MRAAVVVLLGLCAGAARADLVAPKLLQAAPLRYPADGGDRTASVRLEISLDEHGHVADVKVLAVEPPDAPPGFRAAALEHVRALRFSPAMQDGAQVGARMALTLRIAPPATPRPEPPATPKPEPPATPRIEPPAPPKAEPTAPPEQTAPPKAEPAAAPPAPAASRPRPAESDPYGARVRGLLKQAERATSDFNMEIGQLRAVPRKNAAELLTLAPGILLTNEGGEGHAQRIFLRGFDAHEGQDLEFTVAGMPINEVANAHGQGYADTHFIIPELVSSLRVIEGPFDPRQGDFAVAGSAEYHLAVPERGLRVSYRGGSFNTHRTLLLWAPDEKQLPGFGRPGTFGAVELFHTDGYGQNRFAERLSAVAQYEGRLGDRGSFTLLGMSYATRFKSPGVVRQDDYESGRMGFFDSYDLQQGGDAERHSLSARLEGTAGPVELSQQAFLIFRDLRIRENFTGFLLDPQQLYQAPRGADPQRGDLLDQSTRELTVGGRGSMRLSGQVRGLVQRLEIGYYARYDRNEASQLRLRDATVVPYRTDFSFSAGESNLAAYADAELHLQRWLTLRGGARVDFFHFNVENRCDVMDSTVPRAPLDVECYSLDRYGYRDPTARRTATGLALQPRVTLQIEPTAGLFLTGSYGHGARSADPLFLADGEDAPFAAIRAGEGGALYHRALGPLDLTVRGAFYYTHVDRDLIFNQTLGRNTLANGTTRMGVVAAGRLLGPWLDAAVNVTWARATFDEDGLLVPYVPELVVRADVAGFGPLPRVRLAGEPVVLSGGVGFTYVAPRPLPLSERGDPYALLDLQVRARWNVVEVGVSIENVLDRRYRLSEFNYVSDFHSRPFPTLVAARAFVAGPPLSAMASCTLYLDGLFRLMKKI